MELELKVSLRCDVGCVRKTNEDMILVSGERYRDSIDEFSTAVQSEGKFVAAVADGMGGHNAGEVASEMALRLFDDFIVNLSSHLSDNDFRREIDGEIKRIHRHLTNHGNLYPECKGMGTTLVAWMTYGNRIYIIHAGDSRVYRLRNGILCLLTEDHSMQNRHHDFTIPSNVIYNCLGGGGNSVFCDIVEITTKVYEGDVFLLCSDGLHGMLEEENIEIELRNHCNASSLVDAAKARGGNDNVSVIVLTIKTIN